MTKPVLSIITVSFQAEKELQTTIDSILAQTWKHFEYIVIDGGSNDGTMELLKRTSSLFTQAGISHHFLSEPDRGIYDAMNKGSRIACGQWLLFLNAGDLLADNQVLEQVFRIPSESQILYGDTLCIYQGSIKLYPALPLERLCYEMAFCHQSAFIRRELLLKYPYDLTYRVCADHFFFLSMYLKQKVFEYRPFPIAIYEISGYSDSNKVLSHQEKRQMQKELGVFHPGPVWLLREIRFYISQGLKMLFGQRLIDLVRKNRLR